MKKGSAQDSGVLSLKYEIRIAYRYLFAKKVEGGLSAVAWYSLIGVMLSVATLIVIQSVMIGFREEFVSKILGANPHVSIYTDTFLNGKRIGFDENLQSSLKEKLNTIDGVEHSFPVILENVMASTRSANSGVQVFGIHGPDLMKIPLIKSPESVEGDLKDFSRGVAIGAALARHLGVSLGESLRLISPSGAKTAFGITPRAIDVEVSYIFSVGRYDIDSTRVYMPIDKAKKYFNRNNTIDRIDVFVERPNSIEIISDEINLAIMGISETNFVLWNWKQASNSFLTALDVERKAMFVIWSLVVLIAALNIISGLVMLVKNKTQDIAILRTIGFSKLSIMRIFFFSGFFIGVLGTLSGLLLGCTFALNIHEIQKIVEGLFGGSIWDPQVRYLTKIPIKLRIEDITWATTVALVISLIITIFPSYRAASLNPIDGLRNA